MNIQHLFFIDHFYAHHDGDIVSHDRLQRKEENLTDTRRSHTGLLFFVCAIIGLFTFILPARAQPSALVTNAGPGTVIVLKPEETRAIVFQFLNTGTEIWRASGATPIRFRFKGYGNSFRHTSWITDTIPTRLTEPQVKPGEIGTFQITLQGPPAIGIYHIIPYLLYGNAPVAHDAIDLDAYVGYELPKSPEPEPPALTSGDDVHNHSGTIAGAETQPLLDHEPDIRVGLFVVDTAVTISAETEFTISSNGVIRATLGPGTVITLAGARGSYTYTLPNGTSETADTPLRLQALGGILDITSLEKRVSWNSLINDNRFRGVLELYYADNTQRYWMINELPFEHYLKGLAETSQGAPYEYHKALAVATRSYALYHWYAKNKHGGHFDVDATYDQVYRGYGIEQRVTDFGRAIDDTRGMIAMVGDDVAVTPYFSQSDGRTRSWSEVWGGTRAHLVSVPVPWDQGKTLHGHGVGMSAMGAAGMAKDGKGWEEILKYFYTGIDVRRAYP